jgi:hypothetical protein
MVIDIQLFPRLIFKGVNGRCAATYLFEWLQVGVIWLRGDGGGGGPDIVFLMAVDWLFVCLGAEFLRVDVKKWADAW